MDPNNAYLVRKLFELYSTGKYSLKILKDIIAEEGLVHINSGQPLSKSTIHNILSNPLYYGSFRWHGKLYDGKHEAIISKSLFDRVQLILHRSTKPQKNRIEFPFTGLIKCDICGCSYTAEIKKGKYIYYHCTQNKGKCPSPYINQNKLVELMGQSLKALKFEPKFYEGIIEALKESNQDKQKDLKNDFRFYIQKRRKRKTKLISYMKIN